MDRDNVWSQDSLSLLDVGCATGEFIYYLRTQFPYYKYWGLDYEQRVLDRARTIEELEDVTFVQGSAETFQLGTFDIITRLGVLGLFEDFSISFQNLIEHTKKGGRILIQADFNDDAIDVRVHWRGSHPENQPWITNGHNIYSRKSVSDFLTGRVANFEFIPFEMPFDVEKSQDNPLRGWTIETASGRRMIVNGLCMIFKETILKIEV